MIILIDQQSLVSELIIHGCFHGTFTCLPLMRRCGGDCDGENDYDYDCDCDYEYDYDYGFFCLCNQENIIHWGKLALFFSSSISC